MSASKDISTGNGNTPILSLVDQVKQAAVKDSFPGNNALTHVKLLEKINELKLAVETPTETVLRVIYQPPQNAALRIVTDLRIFEYLMEAGKQGRGITAAQLAKLTGAAEGLIVRLMRVMASLRFCNSPEQGVYFANEKTGVMTGPTGRDGVRCIYDLTLPTLSKLPDYFTFTNYANPTAYSQSPMAYAVGQSQFEWLADHQKQQDWFNSYMSSRREGKPNWFDVYPVQGLIQDAFRHEHIHVQNDDHHEVDDEDENENVNESEGVNNAQLDDEEKVFLVDVGGNKGHDLIKFQNIFGSRIPGKLVLQDLPAVIETAGVDANAAGIETMGYNFTDPQPIKGAKIYYFRSIFHDWPDETCHKILLNTHSAMNPAYSRIIIVDFVLSNVETPLIQSSMDIQMMSIGAGVERSERQWTELLRGAGFEIQGIWNFSPGMESVIEAVPIPGFAPAKEEKQTEKMEQKHVVLERGSGVGSFQAEVESVWLQRAFGVGRP